MKRRLTAVAILIAVMLSSVVIAGAASAEEDTFLLTFVGDCTFGCDQKNIGGANTFQSVVKDDYAYPFQNVLKYFANDDFTMANLEGALKNDGFSSKIGFCFRGPTDYVNILTRNSVEAVTIANNHTKDYGVEGYESTKKALADAGETFVDFDDCAMFTTERGLKVGMYAANLTMGMNNIADALTMDKLTRDIASMRSQGAEVIIIALHWGNEMTYNPIPQQTELAHQLIDMGVDIVYGSHPHVLQKVEEYGNGIIYYSLGNFSFGGHPWPDDSDTAVIQQQVIRDGSGRVRLGETTLIPCSVTSTGTGANNYQPTPYAEGTAEYNRVLSKLNGTFR